MQHWRVILERIRQTFTEFLSWIKVVFGFKLQGKLESSMVYVECGAVLYKIGGFGKGTLSRGYPNWFARHYCAYESAGS
jgi:hypothetical protein